MIFGHKLILMSIDHLWTLLWVLIDP